MGLIQFIKSRSFNIESTPYKFLISFLQDNETSFKYSSKDMKKTLKLFMETKKAQYLKKIISISYYYTLFEQIAEKDKPIDKNVADAIIDNIRYIPNQDNKLKALFSISYFLNAKELFREIEEIKPNIINNVSIAIVLFCLGKLETSEDIENSKIRLLEQKCLKEISLRNRYNIEQLSDEETKNKLEMAAILKLSGYDKGIFLNKSNTKTFVHELISKEPIKKLYIKKAKESFTFNIKKININFFLFVFLIIIFEVLIFSLPDYFTPNIPFLQIPSNFIASIPKSVIIVIVNFILMSICYYKYHVFIKEFEK
jgi:uncharacterized membrane protein